MDRYIVKKKRHLSPEKELKINAKKHKDFEGELNALMSSKDNFQASGTESKTSTSSEESLKTSEWESTALVSSKGSIPASEGMSKTLVSSEGRSTASEYLYKGIDLNFHDLDASPLSWRKIKRENLDLDYAILFPRTIADALFRVLEEELEYFTGDLARVQIFGKWHNIPRKQATYGDPGLTYRYSGTVTPSRPWPRPLKAIRDLLVRVTGHTFNFVLINRYKDGGDKMGEHKDDERELDPNTPIASLSLGQPRDFYFKHQDARGPKKANIDKVNVVLENGSLLLMNAPTNQFWYHALPPRKAVLGVRINLTFRKIVRT